MAISAHNLTDGSPLIAAQSWVMVVAIDVLRDELANQTPDKYIRGKMLLAPYSRNADEGGKTVANKFWEEARIFVSKNSGHGPSSGGVLGRK